MTTSADEPGKTPRDRVPLCGRCAYPLDWDRLASVFRCPECGATHSGRWLRAARGRRTASARVAWAVHLVPGAVALTGVALEWVVWLWGTRFSPPTGLLSLGLAIVLPAWFYFGYLPTRAPGREWFRGALCGFFVTGLVWLAGFLASAVLSAMLSLLH